ncbi:TonB-dependent siderophore receptor [Arcobacter sp. CECT 8986]|uniref:TonB-dependent siderophore receptor n=1 Tax=Arcobacter sp. CECT 8986 TaxID=2044507 RepID=UPI001009B230|nr:TonB-dependent siderophore receptor [Arcobacter sp. CECT 8986]RXJ99211.1 TonB-dependent siderophore receptor [Arcobacter sp. CECT 8986]
MKISNKKSISFILSTILLTSSSLFAKDDNNKQTKELDSITVTEKTISQYQPTEKVDINRTGIELDDSAKSIQVYNEDFISDYQPQSLTDIVTMSSNVAYAGDSHGRNNNYIIRGFSGAPTLRDGFNITNAITNSEIFNFEKVEILKGPDSLQYGEANPGGLINIVKKKPTKENIRKVEFEATSNDPSFKPKIDLGGSLNDDGSLRYRLVTTYTHKEDARDFNVDTKKLFIAPSIAYDIDDNNTITFISEYLDDKSPADFGTFVKENGKPLTNRDTITTHPDAEFEKEQKLAGFDFDSNYDTWNSTFRYRYIDLERTNDSVYAPYITRGNPNTITRNFSTQDFDSSEHLAQYTINKEFYLGNLRNRLSLGFDAKKSKTTNSGYYDTTINYILDPKNVNYGGSLSYLSDHPNAYKYVYSRSETKNYGGFIQDHINLTQDLILSLGLRYQKVKTENENVLTDTKNNYTDSATTPQIGLVYKLSPKTTLFANYSESFNPQNSSYIDKNGNLLEPEEGKGYEVGVRQKLFNDNFTLTTSLFKIEKENVAQQDPTATRANMFYRTSEKIKSKGFEIDLMGQITKNWALVASYGYTKTEDINYDNNQLTGVPEHNANIFTTYDLTDLGLKNIYVGAGARYIGSRFADTSNDIKIDSNVIYNAMLGYKKDNWKANFSVKNLTDEDYIETAGTATAAYGERRTAIFTLSYSF